MFGIGGFELLLIVVFVLLVFGPDKLPEIGKMVGRGIRMFNDARHEVESVVHTQILRPEDIEAFGTLTGKRPYTPRPKSGTPAQNALTAQQELEKMRAAEAVRAQGGQAVASSGEDTAAAAEGAPAADAGSTSDAAVTKSLAVAQAEARAAEAAVRAAEAEAFAAEASLRAAEAEAAAAAIVAGRSE